jgi:hypothetical protein
MIDFSHLIRNLGEISRIAHLRARGLFVATPVHANLDYEVCNTESGAREYAEMTPVHHFL